MNDSANIRNKFLDSPHELAPDSIPAWRDALASLSHMQEMRLEGINQGYALPDPGLFLQPTNDATKATYFSTWLKLRSILLHRISRPQSNLEPLSNKMWRNLLSIEKTSPRPETQEGKLRAQVLDILNECALSAHSSLNFNDLSSVPVVWCGQQIQPQQIPPSSIVKQILWELYETNFRLEFLALDSILSKSNEPKEERQIRIDGQCWSNSLVIPDIEEANKGLNSLSIYERAPYLCGLHQAMSSWSGTRPFVLQQPFPSSELNFEKLQHAEKEIVTFYVTSFYRVFGRAAMVPHSLKIQASI